MEPHDYRIFYVNIDSRHQYGISVAESQLFVRVKRPQQRRARMFSQARVHTYSSPWFFHTFSVIRQCQNYRKCMEILRFSKNWSGTSLLSRFSVLFLWTHKLGKVCFLLGGGWARRGGSLVNFLQIEEGQTRFILNWERVTVFLVRKKFFHVVLFCIYKQSYQSRSIEITYRCRKIYISKNYLLRTNIIVSLEPCALLPLFWVFRGVLWFIAFKASQTSHWCFLSVTKQWRKRSL